jgi:hypothetical protein
MNKWDRQKRERLFGHGGMTAIFLAQDSKTEAPELPVSPKMRADPAFQEFFKQFDLDRIHKQTYALQDGFQARSKELFAAEIGNNPVVKGSRFILPLLSTADFLSRREEEVKNWFRLFDVYLRESPTDKGILLASKIDFEVELVALLNKMRDDGLIYPER